MPLLKNVAAALCRACFGVGVLLRILPEGGTKRCIKALAGLYILLAVIQPIGAGAVALPELLMPGSTPGVWDEMEQRQTIALTGKELEQYYQEQFCAEEEAMTLNFRLEQTGNVLFIKQAIVKSHLPIDEEKQQRIAARLMAELQVTDIQFFTEGDIRDGENFDGEN